MHSMYYQRQPLSIFFELLSAILLHLSCRILTDFYAKFIMGSANFKEYRVTQLRSLHRPSVNFPCFFSFLKLKQLISQYFSTRNLDGIAIDCSASKPLLLSVNLSFLSDGSITKIFICLLINAYTLCSQSVLVHQFIILCSSCMYSIGAWILCFFYSYCYRQQQNALQATPDTTGKRRSFSIGSFLLENIRILFMRLSYQLFAELRLILIFLVILVGRFINVSSLQESVEIKK